MQKPVVHYGRILLLVAACCCCKITTAQTSAGYSFEFYNSAHGLPSSETTALAKDSKGFLWIGTSAGVSRYDGYAFHNYNRSGQGDILGYVNVLVADRDSNVWIGTDAGLFCHSGNEIVKISAASHLPQGVNDILLENDGTAWLATENGPVKVRLDKKQTRKGDKIQLANYVLPPWNHKDQSPDNRRIEHIRKAADGTVYMSDQQRVFVLKENNIELLHTVADHGDPILSLFPISRSLLFFNTGETEIHKVENGIHTNIQHAALYRQGVDDQLAGEWHIGSSGLYYFHPQTATASRYINIIDQGVEWPHAMLKDSNFFWVASNTGLIKIKPALFTQYDAGSIIPLHQDYYSFLQLRNGALLAGGNRGNLLEKKDTRFTVARKNLFPSAEIKCLYEDDRGWLWAGSGYQGLALISNNQVKRFTVEDGLHDNSFSQFLKTAKGKLYAIGDHGMSEILVDNNGSVSFKKHYYGSTISKHGEFYAGIELPDGSILIGGEEGLCCFRNDSLLPMSINQQQLPVKSIIKDHQGAIWIATDGEGIRQYVFNNGNLQTVRQFTEADGLPSLHYLQLLSDKGNNIWAASPKGLTFIGRQGTYKDRIVNFDQSDGFTKPGYYTITLYQDRDSVIWAGTTFGIASFKPGTAFFSATAPVVYINVIGSRQNSEAITTSSNNGYAFNDNAFHVGFAALDYANQGNIRYFYKLDGLDTNWTDAGALRNVTYENLSPRQYTFRVKAVNNKGRWSEKEATYSFYISPPFWQKGWFLLLSAGMAIALLLLFIKLREAKQVRQQKARQQATEKEMEMLRLSKDVATSQLTALRMQMNPHFIFNALNSIQHYILQGNVVEANKYLSKFSRLQREILHCSNQQFISLEKELEILTTYLQLEQYRFGGNFTYKINMTEEIEPVEIMVPPMILQPFVENAIWHGLMPVQTERTLSIYFELESDDILLVAIRDNGIGRAASARLKGGGQLNNEYESKGMSMVKQRLQLLQQQYDKPFEVAISDIIDIKGEVMGTLVVLKFFIGNKQS